MCSQIQFFGGGEEEEGEEVCRISLTSKPIVRIPFLRNYGV